MPAEDSNSVDRRDFEREKADIRLELQRDREARALEWREHLTNLKMLAGIDLTDADKMDAFRGAMKWATGKVKQLTDLETKSPYQRIFVIITGISAVVAALGLLWPIVERIFDVALGGKHG